MNRALRKSQSLRCCSVLEVKSKYGAEFRRFSLDRGEPGRYKDFHRLIVCLHHLWQMDVFIGYADNQGELLPINNDDNFYKAVTATHTLLRIFIQLQEEADQSRASIADDVTKRKKAVSHRKPAFQISMPHNFRPVSSIIDVDILPECHRRVRLFHQGSDRPLGFYIRDGTTVKVTPCGLQKVPGIFISRIVSGGLAACTGLLAINDQVLEVNGIEVTGKSLDQVTDMMIANSCNLIITVKPANQHNNIRRKSCTSSSSGHYLDSTESVSYPGLPTIMKAYGLGNGSESEEDADVVIERPIKHLSKHSSASVASYSSQPHVKTSYRPQVSPGWPNSLISAASYHSQPCLANTENMDNRNRNVKLHYGIKVAVRQESRSSHDVRSSWHVNLSRHLMLPQGAMEEDGIVVIL